MLSTVYRNRYINRQSKLGFTVGIALFVAICCCSARPSLERVSERQMVPGAIVCNALGLGRDDFSGFLTYLAANALLYGVGVAALFLIAVPSRWES